MESKKAQRKRDGVDHAVPCNLVRMYVMGMGMGCFGTLGTQVHGPALSSRVCACLHNRVASRAKIDTPG